MRRVALALLAAALVVCRPALRAEADKYDIYVVRFATVDSRPAAFCVLKGADGRVALVDTGFRRTSRLERSAAPDYVSPADAIAPLGLHATDVTDIFLTGAGWDQAGGVDLFPDARVWVQKAAFDYAAGDAWAEPSLHRVLEADDVLALVRRNLAGLVTLVRGDDDALISGIAFHEGRRLDDHGAQYVVVQGREDRFVLAHERDDVAAAMPSVVVANDPETFRKYQKVTERIVRIQ
jgi:hypothetical protein